MTLVEPDLGALLARNELKAAVSRLKTRETLTTARAKDDAKVSVPALLCDTDFPRIEDDDTHRVELSAVIDTATLLEISQNPKD